MHQTYYMVKLPVGINYQHFTDLPLKVEIINGISFINIPEEQTLATQRELMEAINQAAITPALYTSADLNQFGEQIVNVESTELWQHETKLTNFQPREEIFDVFDFNTNLNIYYNGIITVQNVPYNELKHIFKAITESMIDYA